MCWLADLVTVTKSASRFPLADLLTGRDYIDLLADLVTVTKSASRSPSHFCWQIWWQSLNLAADFPSGRFTDWQRLHRSPARFAYWHIWCQSLNLLADSAHHFCWQIWWQSHNLLADSPHHFCWQIWWQLLNLLADLLTGRGWLADLVTVTKSAGRFSPILTGRFGYSHQVFWQICWLADFVTVTKSGGRFPPHFCWQICWLADLVTITKSAGKFANWQIWWDSLDLAADLLLPFLLANLVTVTKSSGRFGNSH